jgi:hypothetical protein
MPVNTIPLCRGVGAKKKDYFFDKKSTTFFHARISRSGKGRVSDFSATRVRVEGVGSPRVVGPILPMQREREGERERIKGPQRRAWEYGTSSDH